MNHINDLATQCARTSDPERIKELIYEFCYDAIGANHDVMDAQSEEVLMCYVHHNLCLSITRANLDKMHEENMTDLTAMRTTRIDQIHQH